MSEVKQVLKGEHSFQVVAEKIEHLVTEVAGTALDRAEHLLAEVFVRRFNILAQNTHPALNLEAVLVNVDPRAVKILHKSEVLGHWQPDGSDLVQPTGQPAPAPVEPEEELNQGSGEPAPVIVPPVVEPTPAPAVVEEPPVDEVKDPADESKVDGDQDQGGERDEEEQQQ